MTETPTPSEPSSDAAAGADLASTTPSQAGARAAGAAVATPPKRPIRDLLEGIGIALLMAVFFKFFAVEAYQIPTSSMQPTMMGSSSAEVYDRLIVDKFRYSLTEPEQWDISVFKYPIREVQNYVKRIVGMPGMSLRVTGGNVYEVTSGDGSEAEHLTVQRKPADLQASLWKNVYPARRDVTSQSSVLGTFWNGRPNRMWSEQDGVLTFEPQSKSTARLAFSNGTGGVINEVWDGYPTDVARKIKEKEGATPLACEQVQDLRFGMSFTLATTPSLFEFTIALERTDATNHELGLFWKDGVGKLELRIDGKTETGTGPLPIELPAGSETSLRLTHYDHLLSLEVGGTQIAEIDCAAFKLLAPPSLVAPRVEFKGSGRVTVSDLTLDRDIHYLPATNVDNLVAWRTKIIKVPEGHYMMFGDNTMQSVDSREWTGITIGVEDGKVVDPKTHPDAKLLLGNLRAMPLENNPDPDENPLPIASRKQIAFTDRAGEVHVLEGQINTTGSGGQWGSGAWFQDDEGNAWHPERSLVQFVPREHMIGRPLLTFWPYWRFGLIR